MREKNLIAVLVFFVFLCTAWKPGYEKDSKGEFSKQNNRKKSASLNECGLS